MKKRNILQAIIVVIGIISIALNFMLFKDARGLFYYTILSNIYVVGFYLTTIILDANDKLVKNNRYYILKGLMLLCIVSTMLVYFAAVDAKDNIYAGHMLECYSVHLVIPMLAVIECLFFENKGVLKYRYIPMWALTSFVYLAVLIFYHEVLNGTFLEGKTYPYDIMNFEKIGWTKGLINCASILLAFNVLGLIIVFIDNRMKKAGGK